MTVQSDTCSVMRKTQMMIISELDMKTNFELSSFESKKYFSFSSLLIPFFATSL